MAEQATGTMDGTGGSEIPAVTLPGTLPGTEHAGQHHPGKPISWIAVTIITIGFIVGGAGMVPRPIWWLFWAGAGVAVIGCILTLFAKTFSDDWY